MSYEEFRKTYKRALKKYPMTSEVFEHDNIKKTVVRQVRQGSKWKTTEEKESVVDYEFYMNTVDSIPFFKNLGGTEKVKLAYTRLGYIPTEIISTSPDREKRTIYTFDFEEVKRV